MTQANVFLDMSYPDYTDVHAMAGEWSVRSTLNDDHSECRATTMHTPIPSCHCIRFFSGGNMSFALSPENGTASTGLIFVTTFIVLMRMPLYEILHDQ
jgi:hypothetical protein